MPFLLEVGFTTGATTGSEYFILDDPNQGLLDSGNLIADAATMTDLSVDSDGRQRVMAFSLTRGSSQQAGALVDYTAGTLSLSLRDDNGDLEPLTIAEPIPGSRIRFSYVWAGVVYPLFAGTIDSWLPEQRAPSHVVVVVTATDALARLAGYNRGEGVPVGEGEDTGARINRILDSIGWSAGDRNIGTGASTLMATTLSGAPLSEIQQAARSEVGEFYADAQGRPTFRSRVGLYSDARSTTVQATFGTGRSFGELPFVGSLGLSYDRTELVNVVRAARQVDEAVVIEVVDEVSRNRYLDQAHEQTDLLLQSDDEVRQWAQYVLARDAQPKLRFTDMSVDVRADEAALYPQVLGRELGDRIAVIRRPSGLGGGLSLYPAASLYPATSLYPGAGGADRHEVHIRGIRHDFAAPNALVTTWELEPADLITAMILDDPVRGLLDAGNTLNW